MPNYYGEVMQAYWGIQHKCWKVRYKAARVIFDEFATLVMRDCIFRGYATNVKGHPAALIEGRLDLQNSSEPNGTPISCEISHPPVFKWDNQDILTVNEMVDTVWLEPNGTIFGSHRKNAPILTATGRNQFNKYATPWVCEWYKNSVLVKTSTVTAIHQWNAVRFLLRLRQTTRRYGFIENDVLTYDDTKGNLVIVRPLTQHAGVDK